MTSESNDTATFEEGQLKVSSLVPEGRWRLIGQSLNLSDRELQITKFLLDGEREETIAGELGISAHTVHAHLRRLYRKLLVTSRTQLVVRIFAEYLLLETHRRPESRRVQR